MKIGLFDLRNSIAKIYNKDSEFIELTESQICDTSRLNFDLVLINLDEKDENFSGLLALYHLRLNKKLEIPIICFGFENINNKLLANPEYFLVYGPRNFYLELPFTISDVLVIYEKLKKQFISHNIFDFYPKFVRPALNEEKLIHENANYFALNKTARAWFNFKDLSKKPAWFKTKFTHYGRYNTSFLASDFLFEPKSTQVSEETKREYEQCNQQLVHLTNNNNFKGKSIIYVDDLASTGWGELFKSIFNEVKDFEIIEKIESIDQVFGIIRDKIEFQNSQNTIIFLDLRLLNEKGKFEINELSGYLLFKKIKIFNPSVPIIIISATDNPQNVKYLYKSGAHFVWQKIGIQKSFSDLDYRRNICLLFEATIGAFSLYRNGAERFVKKYSFYLDIIINSIILDSLAYKNKVVEKNNELLLDTNAFIDIDSTANLNTYIIIEIFLKLGKKVSLVNDVYYELLKFSMWENISETARKKTTGKGQKSSLQIWNAKFAINYLNHKIQQGKISIYSKSDKNDIEIGFYPYRSSFYADPIIEAYSSSNDNLTVLTKDSELIAKLNEKNLILNFSRNENFIWNEDFIKTLLYSVDW